MGRKLEKPSECVKFFCKKCTANLTNQSHLICSHLFRMYLPTHMAIGHRVYNLFSKVEQVVTKNNELLIYENVPIRAKFLHCQQCDNCIGFRIVDVQAYNKIFLKDKYLLDPNKIGEMKPVWMASRLFLRFPTPVPSDEQNSN